MCDITPSPFVSVNLIFRPPPIFSQIKLQSFFPLRSLQDFVKRSFCSSLFTLSTAACKIGPFQPELKGVKFGAKSFSLSLSPIRSQSPHIYFSHFCFLVWCAHLIPYTIQSYTIDCRTWPIQSIFGPRQDMEKPLSGLLRPKQLHPLFPEPL